MHATGLAGRRPGQEGRGIRPRLRVDVRLPHPVGGALRHLLADSRRDAGCQHPPSVGQGRRHRGLRRGLRPQGSGPDRRGWRRIHPATRRPAAHASPPATTPSAIASTPSSWSVLDRPWSWGQRPPIFGTCPCPPYAEAGPLHVNVPTRGFHIDRPDVRCHRKVLSRDDVQTHSARRLTSPVRTFLDLGAHLPTPDLVAVADALLRREMATLAELVERARRHRRRRRATPSRGTRPLAHGHGGSR